MSYTTFNRKKIDATKEPMFLGESVNVARYDLQKYAAFDKLTQKQLSFFWRPEEVDLSNDRKDFMAMPENERHIFLSNLKYQTLLDSVQGRSPNIALLPLVSLPELETWIETWSFSETIHSRSYTHIIRNIVTEPSVIFDDIIVNKHIVKRAESVTEYYDKLIEMSNIYCVHGYTNHTVVHPVTGETRQILVTHETLGEALYLALASVYVLEAIRFYVSFACTFAFGERAIMEGNAKIVKLIARDEALHKYGTELKLKYIQSGQEGPEWAAIAKRCTSKVTEIFKDAVAQEKEWAEYLFKEGSMIGLNAEILGNYVDWIAYQAAEKIGISLPKVAQNPLPWMQAWLVSDNVQVAPQEAEISSYLVGQIDNSVSEDDFDDFELD